jgi:hypothetical protein
MSENLTHPDPAALAAELAAVGAALAAAPASAAGLALAARDIRALVVAALAAPTLGAPDFNGDWAISCDAALLTVLGEEWTLTARIESGTVADANAMTGGQLLSFDFTVPPAADGGTVVLRAGSRSASGEGSGFSFYRGGRVSDDTDWQAAAAEAIRAARDEDDASAAPADDSGVAGAEAGDALGAAAAALGAAAAGAILGGIARKIGEAVRSDAPAPAEAGAAPESTWHFAVAGQTQGPVDEKALRARLASGELPADTQVWKPGLAAWQSATAAGLVATAETATAPAASEIQWHFALAGQARGPIDESELRARLSAGELPPDTMVWHPGLTDWLAADAAGLVTHPAPAEAAPTLAAASQARESAATSLKWHFAVAGQARGPVAEDELRAGLASGKLPPDTPVWHPGLPEWIAASTAGLLDPPASVAPAASAASPARAPRPTDDNDKTIIARVKLCLRCRNPLPAGARFCEECGNPVAAPPTACPRCKATLESGLRFCTVCGAAIA